MALTIGVDIGGTKIAAGVVDEQGTILERVKLATPKNSAQVAATIAEAVNTVRENHEVEAVGLGAAGFVSADRATVLFAANMSWRNEPLRDRIEGLIDLPVVVENDANVAAWGEARFGAGNGQDNVVLLTIPPVSALAAFIAARRLTGRFWPALLAGAVYGFAPFELIHDFQGQPNLTMIALFPLMLYLVLLWWGGALRKTWFVSWLALAMALEFYTFNEAFVDMTAVWTGGLAIGFLVAGRGARLKVLRLAGLTVVAYLVAIALAAPYLIYALRHSAASLTRQNNIYSLHLVRLVLPSSDKLFGLAPLIAYSNRIGRTALEDYVGLPLLLVLLALAAVAWRRRIAWLLITGFVFVIALAAGPNLVISTTQVLALPWGKLWNLPLARSAEPSRVVIFAILVLSIALAVWLALPAGNRLLLAARWGLGLLAVAALFAGSPTSYQAVNPVPPGYQPPATMRPANQLPAFITDGLYRRYLRPGEIVVIITHRGNAAMLFQAAANFYFRIDGGYLNASLTPEDATPYQVEAINDPSPFHIRRFKRYVRTAGIGAIIVERAWAEPWMLTNFVKTGLHGTSVGGVTIYSTGAASGARRA